MVTRSSLAGAAWCACLALLCSCGNTEQQDPVRALNNAACDGDTAALRRSLATGIDVNAANDSGTTTLMLAAREGHLAVAQVLLDSSADLEHTDSKGRTALQYALAPRPVQGGVDGARVVRMVSLLLEHGADPNAETGLVPPLVSVAYLPTHCLELTTLLVDRGARLEQRNAEGQTALIVAAMRGNVDLVQLLVSMGADVNARDNAGNNVVSHARRNPDMLRVLFRNRARPR